MGNEDSIVYILGVCVQVSDLEKKTDSELDVTAARFPSNSKRASLDLSSRILYIHFEKERGGRSLQCITQCGNSRHALWSYIAARKRARSRTDRRRRRRRPFIENPSPDNNNLAEFFFFFLLHILTLYNRFYGNTGGKFKFKMIYVRSGGKFKFQVWKKNWIIDIVYICDFWFSQQAVGSLTMYDTSKQVLYLQTQKSYTSILISVFLFFFLLFSTRMDICHRRIYIEL